MTAARPLRLLTALALVAFGVGFPADMQAAAAQGHKGPVTIRVANQVPLDPGAETPVEIQLTPGEAIPPKAVLIIRGVPSGMTLSEGRGFGAGVWVLPAAQLTKLKLRVPADAKGALLAVALAKPDGTSIAEAQLALVPDAPDVARTATAAPPKAGRPDAVSEPDIPDMPSARLSSEKRAELMLLYDKGNEYLRLGNILIARQFYLRAAENGLSEAAFAFAESYDPNELAKVKIVAGVEADAALAKRWYERAMQLGFPEAAERLSELPRK
ncbi:MAG TPA: hypothetical protein VH858_02090 [Hyphomicrobiales bacterium]